MMPTVGWRYGFGIASFLGFHFSFSKAAICTLNTTIGWRSFSLIHKSDVRERILRHLGLWKQHLDSHEGKTKVPADGPVVMEDFDDGWPSYEEPAFITAR